MDGYCHTFLVTESGIYYDCRDENNVMRTFHAELDGSAQTLLYESCAPTTYYEGKLYLYDFRSGTLYAYGTKANEREILFEGKYDAAFFSADDTGIYFWDDMCDYCHLDPETKEITVLHKGPIGDYFNYYDGTVYYVAYGGENYDYDCCYAMDVKTGEQKAILSLSPEMYSLVRSLGFDGVIMTDDLSMQAVGEYCGENRAAVQALGLWQGNARVLPTTSAVQGFGALCVMNPSEADADRFYAEMEKGMNGVTTAAVALAAKDAVLDGVQIHAGDYMGLYEDRVYIAGKELYAVVQALFAALPQEAECDVVTVFSATEPTEEEQTALREAITAQFPQAECGFFRGGQPTWRYLFALE